MEENTLKNLEETLDEHASSKDTFDEFASIRDHYAADAALTGDEINKIADLAVAYLKGILELFGENTCSIDEYDGNNGELILDVKGGELAVLIGRHGRTLDALQTVLSSLMSSRIKFYYPIVVDIEGYKERRKKKVEEMALSSAERAKHQNGKVSLAPMNAYERRLVHLALMEDQGVTTHSEGEEPERFVVITAVK